MSTAVAASPVFVPAARDRATAWIAAAALAALAVVPWGLEGGASSLLLALRGQVSHVVLAALAAAALFCAWRGLDRGTALAAGAAVLWTFAAGFAAGPRGTSFGLGAAIALIALTACFARAIARRGAFKGDPTVATIVVVIAALLAAFIFFPVGKVLSAALLDDTGALAPRLAAMRSVSLTRQLAMLSRRVVPLAYSAITAKVIAASGMWLQSSLTGRSGHSPRRTSRKPGPPSTRAPMARAASMKRMSPWIESSPTPSMRTGSLVAARAPRATKYDADEASASTCSVPGLR